MWELAVILLLIGGIVLLLAPRIMRSRGSGGAGGASGLGGLGGRGGQMAPGTLLVTGVSAGPDSGGSQYVTITGVINGPTLREHEVYTRVQMNVGTSPSMGQLMPIVYSPKNPDKWGFAPNQAPDTPGSATELI